MTVSIIAIIVSGFTLIFNVLTLFGYTAKVVRFIDRQKEQDIELAQIRHEQSINTVGILACLKGILGEKDEKEIRNAINLIENHLNEQAHR
jgi:hypothetical protein